jgi:hypothetical protein
VSVLRTSASSSTTRIVNGVDLAEPRGTLGTRIGSGLDQHAMDELPDLGQVEGLQHVRRDGPPEKRALLAVENVAGDEDDAVPVVLLTCR